MLVSARIPVLVKHDGGITEAVTTLLSPSEVHVEAEAEFQINDEVELRLDLVGSDMTAYVRGVVTAVTPKPRSRQNEVVLQLGRMSAEDAWNYAAWLNERSRKTTMRSAATSAPRVVAPDVTFTILADFSEVTVRWRTAEAYRRSWAEELSHHGLRVHSSSVPPAFGATARVVLILPDAPTLILPGRVVHVDPGVVVLQLDLPAGEALRLRRLAHA